MNGDPKRDIPPTIADPDLAALAARFMAGEIPVRDKHGDRYRYDGKRDVTCADGRRVRSRKARGPLGVTGATFPRERSRS